MSILSTNVELTDLSFEVDYVMDGAEIPATRETPAEHHYPVVQRCTVLIGRARLPVAFELLPQDMQDEILDSCVEEAALDSEEDDACEYGDYPALPHLEQYA